MSERDLQVLFIPTSNSGITFYRMYQYVESAMRRRLAHFHLLWWQWGLNETHPWEVDINEPEYAHRIGAELWEKVRQADVVVVGICHTKASLGVFRSVQEMQHDPRWPGRAVPVVMSFLVAPVS